MRHNRRFSALIWTLCSEPDRSDEPQKGLIWFDLSGHGGSQSGRVHKVLVSRHGNNSAPNIVANSSYGDGKFIRSLHITSPKEDQISLAMEDALHALQIQFSHDNHLVTHISARWHRHPMSACSGANQALEAMVGCPLSGNLRTIAQHLDSRQQCTHFFDMLSLGISHARHGRDDRRYDVIVPDASEGLLNAYLNINGQTVLHFVLEDHQYIVKPEHYQGISYLRGFSSWAREALSEQEFEYAFIMQRALFVAQSRRMDISRTIGKPAHLSGPPLGSCFMAQPGRYENSIRLDTEKDLSMSETEDLLKFFDPL